MPYAERSNKAQVAIQKERLNGYRRPTVPERERITPYLTKEFSRMAKVQRVLSVIVGYVACAMLYGVYETWIEQQLCKKIFAPVILFAGFLAACVALVKCSIRNKRLIRKVAEGDFEVLDCVGEAFNAHIDSVSKGSVHVRTNEGVLCANEFIIDKATARRYEHQSGIPLLLMRQREHRYYEMLTENKLKENAIK